jgi:predicted DNA-binding protein YlxM (UPF0122 family)
MTIDWDEIVCNRKASGLKSMLKDFINKGLTINEIANSLQVSRSAVEGLFRRLNLKSKPKQKRKVVGDNACEKCGLDKGVNIKICNNCLAHIDDTGMYYP